MPPHTRLCDQQYVEGISHTIKQERENLPRLCYLASTC